MAQSGKIKHSDLVEDKVFQPTIEQGKQLLDVMKNLEAGFRKNLAASKEFFTSASPKSAKDIEKYSSEVKKLKDNVTALNLTKKREAELNKIVEQTQRDQIKADRESEKLKQDKLKTGSLEEKQRLANIALVKKQLAQAEKETGTINKAIAANARLRREVRSLELGTKEGKKRQAELNAEIDKNSIIIAKNSDKLIQRKINIGNYKDSIKEAIGETKLFSEGLNKLGSSGNLIVDNLQKIIFSLGNLQKAQQGAEATTGKLSKALKVSGIGLIIVALTSITAAFTSTRKGALQFDLLMGSIQAHLGVLVGSLAKVGTGLIGMASALKLVFQGEFSKAGDKASEALDKIGGAFDNYSSKVEKNKKDISELTKLEFEYNDILRIKQRALKDITLDLEDQNEISADATLGFKQRNIALEKAIVLASKKAHLEKEIADTELDFSNRSLRIKLRENGITKEFSDEQLKDLTSLAAFKNEVGEEDLKRQQEAILKQKEADDAVNDLQRKAGERKRTLSDDEFLQELELLRSKRKSSTAQHDILLQQLADEKNQLEQRRGFAKQLLEVNENTFKEQIRLFKEQTGIEFDENELLGEQNSILLARKIKAYDLSVAKTNALAVIVKKTQDAEIEGKKELAKLDEEEIKRKEKIAQLRSEIAADDLQEQIDITRELKDLKKEDFDRAKFLIEKEFNLRQKQLKDNAEIARQNAADSIKDEQIRAQEIKKINNKLAIDLRGLARDNSDELKAIRDAEIEDNYQRVKTIVDAVADGLNQASEKKQDALEKEIEMNADALDRQYELAAKGLDNQVAFEEKKKVELQAALEREKEKEQRQEEALQLANIFLEFLKERAKSDPNSAPARALADTLIARGISRAIAGAFAEGVENLDGQGTETSDSNIALLSKGESVITAGGTKENPGLATAMNKGTVDEYFKDIYLPKFNSDNSLREDVSTKKQVDQAIYSLLNKRLASLEQAVKDKKELSINWNAHGERVEETIKNGLKEVRKYVSTGKQRL